MADIFISYVHEDRAKVRSLVEALKHQGWSVWWDPEIVPGEHYDRVIERELDAAACIIVVWSAISLGSDNVRNEAIVGRNQGCLIQVTVDGASWPSTFAGWQAVDLSNWLGKANDQRFLELCAGVRRLTGRRTDWDQQIFWAYRAQRDRIGIKSGAKPGEMMSAMIGEPGRRTELAHTLLAEWTKWFGQPEHNRRSVRTIRCPVSPTSASLIPFALFLNEAISKLLREEKREIEPIMPKYLCAGVGVNGPRNIVRQVRAKLPIDLTRPQALVDAVSAAVLDARLRGAVATKASVLVSPHSSRIVGALEEVCRECAERMTPRVILPLPMHWSGPLRQILKDLFVAPQKISVRIPQPLATYELEPRFDKKRWDNYVLLTMIEQRDLALANGLGTTLESLFGSTESPTPFRNLLKSLLALISPDQREVELRCQVIPGHPGLSGFEAALNGGVLLIARQENWTRFDGWKQANLLKFKAIGIAN